MVVHYKLSLLERLFSSGPLSKVPLLVAKNNFSLPLLQFQPRPQTGHLTIGSYGTLPARKRSRSNSDLLKPSNKTHDPAPTSTDPDLVSTSSLRITYPPLDFAPLRRWNSVEVLLDEPIVEKEELAPPTHLPLPSYLHSISVSYNRSISTHSSDLNTPSSIVGGGGGHKFSPGFNSPLHDTPLTSGFHDGSRMSSRRGSASSVIIIPHNKEEEEIPGFEIVGRVSSRVEVREGEEEEGPKEEGVERRRSSVTEYVLPAATIAVHAIAIGIMYATS